MPAEDDTSIAICRDLMAAFAARDPDAVIARLDPRVVLEVAFPFLPGEGTTGTRRQKGDAVRNYVRDAAARTTSIVFRDESWDVTRGGTVIYRADGEMTLEDGRPYRNHYLFLFGLQEGLVSWWREYYNPVGAARAFGAPLDDIPVG